MSREHFNQTHATATLIGLLVALSCNTVVGQESSDEVEPEVLVEDMVVTPARAQFVLTVVASPDTQNDDDGAADDSAAIPTQLRAAPAGMTSPDGMTGPDPEPEASASLSASEWMQRATGLETPTVPRLDWTGAEIVQAASAPGARARHITARTSGVFGVEAAQLTPLTGGKQMFALEVAEGLTLAGIGSRRMWTERDRAFVLAAEAEWQFTPYAGLHVGYEVLQAPLGGELPDDAGGDSIFARFQLRF